MVRTFPILFMYEINGEEHKLICNRQGSTFTVYIDDEKATSFQKKNFYLNSEHIFNFKGHEYCLFFYSEKLYLINSPAMLVIDGVRTENTAMESIDLKALTLTGNKHISTLICLTKIH